MKVLVIFGLLFVYVQALDPNEVLAQTAAAVRDCVEEQKLDGAKILQTLGKNPLPTDDSEFVEFFACYYNKLRIIKENGELDEELLQQLLPIFIHHKFGKNVDSEKIAAEAKEKCKDIQDSSVVVRAIKLRNCALLCAAEHK